MEKSENKIPKQILFVTDLEKLLGRNRLTLRRWWTSGKFPEPVKLNGTTLVWHQDTITNWIDQNIRFS
ncbi:AlpA family phage regulatory protein [Legionella pneumophila]